MKLLIAHIRIEQELPGVPQSYISVISGELEMRGRAAN